MNERDRLYRSILAEPDDDAPRLVFADWLEENGDHDRATFIRAQLALAALVRGIDQCDAHARVHPLWQQHGSRWEAEFPRPGAGWSWLWKRGFPAGVKVTNWQAFLADADAAFAAAPLTDLWIEVSRADADAFIASPGLGRFRRLMLAPDGHWEEDRFYDRPSEKMDDWWEYDDGLTPEQIARLAATPTLASLVDLTLVAQWSGVAGLGHLFDSPFLTGLRGLNLSQPYVNQHYLGEAEVRRLASSPSLSGLAELYLRGSQAGPGGAVALANSPHLTRLARLDLCGNLIGEAGAEALAAGPLLRATNELNLDGNDIGDRGMIALAGSPHVARLRVLSVGWNTFTDAGLAALAESPHLGALERLDLIAQKYNSTPLTPTGLARLVHSPRLASLRELRLPDPYRDQSLTELRQTLRR